MLKITDYAEKLIEGLDHVDYIERVKVSRKNWISIQVQWISPSRARRISFVYTTRCNTACSVLPHVVIITGADRDKYKDELKNWDVIAAYRDEAAKKSDFERAELAKEKTGVQIERSDCS